MSQVILDTQINQIKKIVKENTDVNIDDYVTSFLNRRIQSRMCMIGIDSVSKYVSLLKDDFVEALEFNASLSINVTEFFRDQTVWDIFQEKIIPEVIKKSKDSDKIKVWSAGCATGNEPYSLAMMLANALEDVKKEFMITANDMNSTLVAIAETGKYEQQKLMKIPKSLFSKYLEKIDDDLFQFKDELKKSINFQTSKVNAIEIYPVDIIVCRNLLIYYGEEAKNDLFNKFYMTLKDYGILILGMFERLSPTMEKSFEIINAGQKIYRKIPLEKIKA